MQVGADLELVSKDDRELQQSKAELEALLLQQRSAQASSVDSPPSTSFSDPAAAQQPQWRPRVVKALPTPKQAIRPKSALAVEAASGAQAAAGEATGSSHAPSRAAAGTVEFSAASGGSSPFASISGRGAKARQRRGSNNAVTEARSADANSRDAHFSDGREEDAGTAAGTGSTYFGNGSSVSHPVNGRSGTAGVSSGDFSLEKDHSSHGLSVQQPDLQPGKDNLPGKQRLLRGAVLSEPAEHANGGSGLHGEHADNKDFSQKRQSTTGEQNRTQLEEWDFIEGLGNGRLEASRAEQAELRLEQAASEVGSVRWLRPRSSMAPPLQVRKGKPLDALRHTPASHKAFSQGATAVEDNTAAAAQAVTAEAEDSSTAPKQQHAHISAASVQPGEQADTVTDADVTVDDDVTAAADNGDPHNTASDADPSVDAGGAAPPPQLLDNDHQASPAAESVAENPNQRLQPSSHEVFSSLIRQRQQEKAVRPRPGLSSPSWDAKWDAGPEAEAPQHGGSREQLDWQRPRQPLRRTTRSSLRHGRSTVQVAGCLHHYNYTVSSC